MAKRKGRRAKLSSVALARVQPGAVARVETPGVLGVFERLAKDPKLTPAALRELIELQERIMAADAKAAFDTAYKAMQPQIPTITKRGIIRNKEKQIQSRYARYEDIRRVVDPILAQYGFHTHSRTEWPETGVMEVVGMLTHERGHTRESRFRTTADPSGGKNAIQGLGSGNSYGKRYTLKDLLAIVEEGIDDDGQAHGRAPKPEAKEPTLVHQTAKETITLQMRDRLVKIAGRVGRDGAEIKRWLKERYGFESTAEITRDLFDEIMQAIEKSGPLPVRA